MRVLIQDIHGSCTTSQITWNPPSRPPPPPNQIILYEILHNYIRSPYKPDVSSVNSALQPVTCHSQPTRQVACAP